MALAHVQSKSAQGSNTTSVTTAGITTTSGNGIIVSVVNNGQTHTSVTDNKGNTYTKAAPTERTTGGERTCQFYCANITGGSGHTFTYTIGSTGFPTISVMEVSGAALASLFDVGTQNNDTTTPYNTTSDPTTTQADEILVVCGGHGGSSMNFVAGTNYTLVASGTHPSSGSGIETDASNMPLGVNYRIVAATGTYDGEIRTASSASTSISMGTYKAAAGGGATPTPQLALLGVGS